MKMPRLVWILLLAVSSCKSTAEQLRGEGYSNVREMAPLRPCPEQDPDLRESFVADRDGRAWEIKFCCHSETEFVVSPCVDYEGEVSICSGFETRRYCDRYVDELRAEE